MVTGVENTADFLRTESNPPPKLESTFTVTEAKGKPVGMESVPAAYILHVNDTTALSVVLLCQAKKSKPATVIALGAGYH